MKIQVHNVNTNAEKDISCKDNCLYANKNKDKYKVKKIVAGNPQVSDQVPHGPGEGSGFCTHRSHHDNHFKT